MSSSGIMWEDTSKTETSQTTPGKEAGSQILVPVSETPSLGIRVMETSSGYIIV